MQAHVIHFNLRLIREYLGLSQEEFGTPLGLSRHIINKYEHHQSPPVPVFVALCQHYGVNMELVTTTDLAQVGIEKAFETTPVEREAWLTAKMDQFNSANSTTKQALYKTLLLDVWASRQQNTP